MDSGQSLDETVCSVLEHYGRTMYFVQMLERSLKNIVILTDLTQTCNEERMLDTELIEQKTTEVIHKYSRSTLGQLKDVFIQQHKPPNSIRSILKRWNDQRIYLAHYYLSDNFKSLKSNEECLYLIQELNSYTDDFTFAWKYIYKLEEGLSGIILTPVSVKYYIRSFLLSSVS